MSNVTQKVLQKEVGVSVDRLTLITGSGNRIDEGLQFVELNVFEDIFSHSISASLVIDDALNLLEKLHVCGQEWMFIRISKPGLEDADGDDVAFSLLLRVYKIEKLTQTSAFMQRYMMLLCREELILSHQNRVSRSYRLIKPEVAIKDIFVNHFGYDSENTFKSEFEVYPLASSAVGYSYVIPSLKPFDAISYLASIARGENGINDYLFFESSAGFRFESLSTLMSAKPDMEIRYKVKNVVTSKQSSDDPYVNMNSPIRIDADVVFDYMKSLVYGEFGIQSDFYDMSRQIYIPRSMSYEKFLTQYKKDKTLNKFPKIPKNNWKELVSGTTDPVPYHSIFTPIQTFFAPHLPVSSFVSEAIATRLMQLESITNQKLHLHMPGSPLLKVGHVIKLHHPSISSHSKEDMSDELLDRYLAANYLITAIRHVITASTWDSYCEISKDTLPNELPEHFAEHYTIEGL